MVALYTNCPFEFNSGYCQPKFGALVGGKMIFTDLPPTDSDVCSSSALGAMYQISGDSDYTGTDNLTVTLEAITTVMGEPFDPVLVVLYWQITITRGACPGTIFVWQGCSANGVVGTYIRADGVTMEMISIESLSVS
jgi:hypothetical protein